MCCSSFSCSMHFILVWCILRPHEVLHTFLQMQFAFMVKFMFRAKNLVSITVGFLSSPPPSSSGGIFKKVFFFACFSSSGEIQCELFLSQSPSFQAPNCLSSRHQSVLGRHPVSSWESLARPDVKMKIHLVDVIVFLGIVVLIVMMCLLIKS